MSDSAEKVYLSFHKSFVKENIPYIDRSTGEDRTFNSVTLPSDTVIDGRNVGGFQFSPRLRRPEQIRREPARRPPLANRDGVAHENRARCGRQRAARPGRKPREGDR